MLILSSAGDCPIEPICLIKCYYYYLSAKSWTKKKKKKKKSIAETLGTGKIYISNSAQLRKIHSALFSVNRET